MNNKKLIYAFACGLSILFAGIYYAVFLNLGKDTTTIQTQISESTLYMNQVGLYKQSDSIEKMLNKLKGLGLTGYQRNMGDITAVVCGVSTSKKETVKAQAILEKNQITFLLKNAKTTDKEVIQKIQDKDYAGALELMKQSK